MLADYPEYVAKNLNMAEKDVTGPASAELAVPQGIYIESRLSRLRKAMWRRRSCVWKRVWRNRALFSLKSTKSTSAVEKEWKIA